MSCKLQRPHADYPAMSLHNSRKSYPKPKNLNLNPNFKKAALKPPQKNTNSKLRGLS